MSVAITRLHLEQPPVTVHRTGSCMAPLWSAECGECGYRTRPQRLISTGITEQFEHAAMHAYDARIEAQERREAEARAERALEAHEATRRQLRVAS